jgi:hypothetical protein
MRFYIKSDNPPRLSSYISQNAPTGPIPPVHSKSGPGAFRRNTDQRRLRRPMFAALLGVTSF